MHVWISQRTSLVKDKSPSNVFILSCIHLKPFLHVFSHKSQLLCLKAPLMQRWKWAPTARKFKNSSRDRNANLHLYCSWKTAMIDLCPRCFGILEVRHLTTSGVGGVPKKVYPRAHGEVRVSLLCDKGRKLFLGKLTKVTRNSMPSSGTWVPRAWRRETSSGPDSVMSWSIGLLF